MDFSEYLTAYRELTLDDSEAQDSASLEARKKAAEEDATQELYAKIGPNNLADFLPFPKWTEEEQPAQGETPARHLYKLKVTILWKP